MNLALCFVYYNSFYGFFQEKWCVFWDKNVFLVFFLDFLFFLCQNLPRTAEAMCLHFDFGVHGNIAQLVEQMTFNHWVQGSSPCVPTINKKRPSGRFFVCVQFSECRVQTKCPNILMHIVILLPPNKCKMPCRAGWGGLL